MPAKTPFSRLVHRLAMFLSLGVAFFAVGTASGQGTLPTPWDPFPNFTNSLQTGVGDPGVIYVRDAKMYIGGKTTPNGDFLIYQSPNLEDLFLQPVGGPNVYDMSQYADPSPHAGAQFTDPSSPTTPSSYNGFVDPRFADPVVAGQTDHDCGWNSPTFVVWQGVVYMAYEVRPKGASAGACGGVSNAATLTANADAQAGHPDKNPGFVSSPILVMYNTDPSDLFARSSTKATPSWETAGTLRATPFRIRL